MVKVNETTYVEQNMRFMLWYIAGISLGLAWSLKTMIRLFYKVLFLLSGLFSLPYFQRNPSTLTEYVRKLTK